MSEQKGVLSLTLEHLKRKNVWRKVINSLDVFLAQINKKADVAESAEGFHHIGLLFNPQAAHLPRAF